MPVLCVPKPLGLAPVKAVTPCPPSVGSCVLFPPFDSSRTGIMFYSSQKPQHSEQELRVGSAVSLFAGQMNKQACEPEELTPELRPENRADL